MLRLFKCPHPTNQSSDCLRPVRRGCLRRLMGRERLRPMSLVNLGSMISIIGRRQTSHRQTSHHTTRHRQIDSVLGDVGLVRHRLGDEEQMRFKWLCSQDYR